MPGRASGPVPSSRRDVPPGTTWEGNPARLVDEDLVRHGWRQRLAHDWLDEPLPANVVIGEGSWVYSAFAFLHCRASGRWVSASASTPASTTGTFFDLGPDGEVDVGDYCSIVGADHQDRRRVSIGDYAFIAHEVVIADDAFAAPPRIATVSARIGPTLGSDVWVGMGAVIIGPVSIGDGAVIAARAVVTQDVPRILRRRRQPGHDCATARPGRSQKPTTQSRVGTPPSRPHGRTGQLLAGRLCRPLVCAQRSTYDGCRRRGSRDATFMYMERSVGVAELRQNLSRYLRLVEKGERLLVTDRNRPVAELGPPPSTGAAMDRLIAAGKVVRPTRRGLPGPLRMDGDPYALTRALDEIRGER